MRIPFKKFENPSITRLRPENLDSQKNNLKIAKILKNQINASLISREKNQYKLFITT